MALELKLQKELIKSPPKPYTRLVGREWGNFGGGSAQVSTNTDHIGKGDLVFQIPNQDHYLVVETKHLRTDSGSSARTKRNASRRKVLEQAFRYGALWRGHLGKPHGTVTMATYTNEMKGGDDATEEYTFQNIASFGSAGSNHLEILGQVDYLTPALFDCSDFEQILTAPFIRILNQERVQRIFMVVRIHNNQDTSFPFTPRSFQDHFENYDAAYVEPKSSACSLEEIANGILNYSGFYEPFAPYFIVAPNNRKELLRRLKSFLRQLKR